MPKVEDQSSNLLGPGFIVLSGAFHGSAFCDLLAGYELALGDAPPEDVKVGSTTTRINRLLDRAPCLRAIASFQPLLSAASALIGRRFKLSSFHSRSVHPGAAAQRLHQDVGRGEEGWPLLGFIFMVDEFRRQNGATRFFPHSSHLETPPVDAEELHACGPAGSMIIFDGCAWHGHSANQTSSWRRSIQGAFVPAQ